MNGIIKGILYQTLGLSVYRKSPLGTNVYENLKHFYNGSSGFQVFFDVGANIGQSTIEMRKAFPLVKIYSFEPQPHVYTTLVSNTSHLSQIYLYQAALGASIQTKAVSIDPEFKFSTRFSLNKRKEQSHRAVTEHLVSIKTIDSFATDLQIGQIDYLKIDTEGYELKVLAGAQNLMSAGKISFIEAEVAVNAYNSYHVSLHEIQTLLTSFKYELFGIYEQVHEWKTRRPVLRRINAVFIHQSCSNGA